VGKGVSAGGHRHSQRDRHVQCATDATVLGGLAELRDLGVVERSGDDDLGVDAGDPALGLGGAQTRLASAERPLLSFGEPPNVRQLSGADGAEQHLGRRRPFVTAARFRRRVEHHAMRPDRRLRLHRFDPLHADRSGHELPPRSIVGGDRLDE
jgi:hypothetical protein